MEGNKAGCYNIPHIMQSAVAQLVEIEKLLVQDPLPVEPKWRSQNAENVSHIKERLLDQAVLLFNCVPFHSGNFS